MLGGLIEPIIEFHIVLPRNGSVGTIVLDFISFHLLEGADHLD